MSKAIDVILLNKEIMKYLMEYQEEIGEHVENLSKKIGKEAVNELRANSPKGVRKRYCKGWTTQSSKIGRNKFVLKIYNKTDGSLTHLLEYGHATVDGGRTKAIVHIRPVEEKYSKKFEENLKEKVRR